MKFSKCFLIIGLFVGAANAFASISISGVAIGASERDVITRLGQAVRVDQSQYGFQWHIYNQDYRAYVQVGIRNGRVVGLFTNSADLLSSQQARIGMDARAVRAIFGKPVDHIRRGNIRYLIQSNGEFDVFLDNGGSFITIYYDVHEGQTVTSIQLIEKQEEIELSGRYGIHTDELRRSFEAQSLDLANAIRVRFGLSAMKWSPEAASVARSHSEDMLVRQYFAHDGPGGPSMGDRMRPVMSLLGWRGAAENIARGQVDTIQAHEAWMNSLGHRRNILKSAHGLLGVGVAFESDGIPLYTQNFGVPR
jgi:uncharacterized protein YkwD